MLEHAGKASALADRNGTAVLAMALAALLGSIREDCPFVRGQWAVGNGSAYR